MDLDTVVLPPKVKDDRLVDKHGNTNILKVNVPDQLRHFLADACTTLLDIRWRWNILIFFAGFILTWLVFGAFFHLLCVLHGDLEPHNLDPDSGWLPCVTNVQSFASSVLFSIETMTTIGYGYRYVTEACPGAYVGVVVESILGAALQFALAGLVVAKLRRAKKRSQTILFSSYACLYQEDDKMKLVIRLGDMRNSFIMGAHAHGYLIRKVSSRRGDVIPINYFPVDFRSAMGQDRIFLWWPAILVHDVTEESPFWDLSYEDLRSENLELVVMLEGVVGTTSAPFQARKSYQTWQILWGYGFVPLKISVEEDADCNVVDFQGFHHVRRVATPLCSAKDIRELRQEGRLTEEGVRERRISRVSNPSDSLTRMRKTSSVDTFLGTASDEEHDFPDRDSVVFDSRRTQ